MLLDFHYSDTWADPGKQYKPAAWKGLSFFELTKSLHNYTKEVMLALKHKILCLTWCQMAMRLTMV